MKPNKLLFKKNVFNLKKIKEETNQKKDLNIIEKHNKMIGEKIKEKEIAKSKAIKHIEKKYFCEKCSSEHIKVILINYERDSPVTSIIPLIKSFTVFCNSCESNMIFYIDDLLQELNKEGIIL